MGLTSVVLSDQDNVTASGALETPVPSRCTKYSRRADSKLPLEISREVGEKAITTVPADAGHCFMGFRCLQFLHSKVEPLSPDELHRCAVKLLTEEGLEVASGVMTPLLQIGEGEAEVSMGPDVIHQLVELRAPIGWHAGGPVANARSCSIHLQQLKR